MFKILLSTMLLFAAVAQAKNTKTLSCEESDGIFYTFGLAADFSGPNIVGDMVVSSRNQRWSHTFEFPVMPRHSTDKVRGVEKTRNYTSFEYKLENRNGCAYFLHLPVDVIDYQTYDANLKNTFVGNYMIVCPAKNKHIEKVMTCQFVDATGTPRE